MAATLYQLLEWAKTHGDQKVIERVRIRVLPLTIEEGVILAQVAPDTAASETVLRAVRQAVTEVVGRPCPL